MPAEIANEVLPSRRRTVSGEIATDRLYRIARRALHRVLRGEPAEFEDLLQTVLERVLRSLRDRTFTRQCSLPTWVSVIAANVAIDWVRSTSRCNARLELVGDFEVFGSSLEELLEARSALRYADNVIATMLPGHGDPFVLYDVHGLDLREIADMLNISVAAAQSRVVRARQQLRQKLEALEREGSPEAPGEALAESGEERWREA